MSSFLISNRAKHNNRVRNAQTIRVKYLMLQLLEGVKYLNNNWVLHQDLKKIKFLLNNRGDLKISDFGMVRQYDSPLKSYTHRVVTLRYRTPELLLGSKLYITAIIYSQHSIRTDGSRNFKYKL